jgi:hypothetical protein
LSDLDFQDAGVKLLQSVVLEASKKEGKTKWGLDTQLTQLTRILSEELQKQSVVQQQLLVCTSVNNKQQIRFLYSNP